MHRLFTTLHLGIHHLPELHQTLCHILGHLLLWSPGYMGQKVMNQASNDTLEISQFILLWQPRECCVPREKRISCRSWAPLTGEWWHHHWTPFSYHKWWYKWTPSVPDSPILFLTLKLNLLKVKTPQYLRSQTVWCNSGRYWVIE